MRMAENVKYPQDEERNEYRYIDFAWLDEIAMGLTAGAKKHPGETWREIPAKEHVARAIRHLSMHQTGDSSEPHLINASMRCMMAFATATGVTKTQGAQDGRGKHEIVRKSGERHHFVSSQ